jgi:hypothetical protein
MNRWIAPLTMALLLVAGAGAAQRPEPTLSGGVLRPATEADISAQASVSGKYRGLLHRIRVPADEASYGKFHDYGHWDGTSWAGFENLKPGFWVYVAPDWYVWSEEAPARAEKRDWGPEQATGEPDTPDYGDIVTAWASKTEDAEVEWLALEYAEPCQPVAVIVHETFNPGAVYRVTGFRENGEEVELWKGKDPVRPGDGRRVAIIPVRPDFAVRRIKVYLDSANFPGWNEIDAVGLVDDSTRIRWAVKAEASSTYADD